MDTIFHIERPDEGLKEALQTKIDNLTKPKGSLGRLELLALQAGLIQQSLSPVLRHPINVIFASDHGIADEGVSQSPKEVTRQVIYNFLNGGAGVCFLARQHGFELRIVDGGVDYDFPSTPKLIDRKIRKGTRDFLYEAAMTQEEMEKAIRYGAEIVSECDVLLVIGTSLVVYPAAGLVNYVRDGVPVYLVDPNPIHVSYRHYRQIQDVATSGMRKFMELVPSLR